jgi:hypothetical protein
MVDYFVIHKRKELLVQGFGLKMGGGEPIWKIQT